MKNATRWLLILALFILAACNPPEPGGDLEQLPQQPESADVPNLPPEEPVFMHSIPRPQPGEVIQQSPYPVILFGTSHGNIDHFEVWVDGGLVGTSSIIDHVSGGPDYGILFSSQYEWIPASQGDHTIAVRAVGDGVNNFSQFLSVEVTVNILPSIPGEVASGFLPDCTPADLEAPALITPMDYGYVVYPFMDSAFSEIPMDLFLWANSSGCIPDEYTLLISDYPNIDTYTEIITTEGSMTSAPSEDEIHQRHPHLEGGRQYYWTVFASADGVAGPRAPVRTFFAGPPCLTLINHSPMLISPGDGEVVHTPNVQLLWIPGAHCLWNSYRIDLRTDPEFSQAVRGTILTGPETNWITPELENCTTYYWRVAVLHDGVLGQFSYVRSFTTDFGVECARGPWLTARFDQPCFVGPDPASYSIAGYILEGETASIMAQDLTGAWWAIENPDDVGTCYVRMADNQTSGDTSGLPTWRDPVIGGPACTQNLTQGACLAAGGSWVEPLSSAPYCDCP